MEDQSLDTRYSILDWDQNNWVIWKKLATPLRLKSKWENLKFHLVGVHAHQQRRAGQLCLGPKWRGLHNEIGVQPPPKTSQSK